MNERKMQTKQKSEEWNLQILLKNKTAPLFCDDEKEKEII